MSVAKVVATRGAEVRREARFQADVAAHEAREAHRTKVRASMRSLSARLREMHQKAPERDAVVAELDALWTLVGEWR